jgi:hypothetical protein
LTRISPKARPSWPPLNRYPNFDSADSDFAILGCMTL